MLETECSVHLLLYNLKGRFPNFTKFSEVVPGNVEKVLILFPMSRFREIDDNNEDWLTAGEPRLA